MSSAIVASDLGKRYRLGVDASGYDTLRDALRRTFRRRGPELQEHWALRGLDLQVEEGEALGVIGHNGAGKTTLLRILAGITEPTCGEVRTRGRVGALLDVGTGFHPELTGSENVYLSGAVLGLRQAAIRRRFDDIVEFSGLEDFLETPVKRYSAGMRLRLAFAVAAHIEPPILVIDEILAVGDAAFQERCLGKMEEIGRRERTLLFVSHDLGAVTRLCRRAIWLEGGRLRDEGPADAIVTAYLQTSVERPLSESYNTDDQDASVVITAAAIRDGTGAILSRPRRGEAFVVELKITLRTRVPGLDFAVRVVDEGGVPVMDDARADYPDVPALAGDPGKYCVRARIPGILLPGRYVLGSWIGTERLDYADRHLLAFEIAPRPDDRRLALERRRSVAPPVEWSVTHEPSP